MVLTWHTYSLQWRKGAALCSFFSAVILGHSSADYKEYTGQQGEASVKKERKYRRPRE
jgi:hypothetical protein